MRDDVEVAEVEESFVTDFVFEAKLDLIEDISFGI